MKYVGHSFMCLHWTQKWCVIVVNKCIMGVSVCGFSLLHLFHLQHYSVIGI